MAEEYNYDAWGRRRNPSDWTYDNVPVPTLTDRGFTFHEHMDKFGLINMNGRIYDPLVGRMLSPDPMMQAAGSTQGLNRYSYCFNNPLKYVDPSGNSAYGSGGSNPLLAINHQLQMEDNSWMIQSQAYRSTFKYNFTTNDWSLIDAGSITEFTEEGANTSSLVFEHGFFGFYRNKKSNQINRMAIETLTFPPYYNSVKKVFEQNTYSLMTFIATISGGDGQESVFVPLGIENSNTSYYNESINNSDFVAGAITASGLSITAGEYAVQSYAPQKIAYETLEGSKIITKTKLLNAIKYVGHWAYALGVVWDIRMSARGEQSWNKTTANAIFGALPYMFGTPGMVIGLGYVFFDIVGERPTTPIHMIVNPTLAAPDATNFKTNNW